MATDDVQYTYKATSHNPGRPRGFQTDSKTLAHGVNVQGNVVGVYGESLAQSPLTRESPPGTGVCGLGDTAGVIGQGDPVGAVPPAPKLTTGVVGYGGDAGVYATGNVFAVHGENIFTDPGGTQGTGVQGTSLQGVGVWGVSSGYSDEAQPYIGVFGSAQAIPNSSDPYPTSKFANNTGVLGIGDQYGGVFQVTSEIDRDPAIMPPAFANVQLTPISLPANINSTVAKAYPAQKPPIAPKLPPAGQAGDIVVVKQTSSPPAGGLVQVWVCLKSKRGSAGAVWARVNFDYIYQA